MIQALCNIYAHTAAAVWSGIGWPMSARGNAILCGATAVIVNPGCLALRAVTLSGWAGVACAIMIRRAWPFPLGLALGALMSWLRVFLLAALAAARPALFHALHSRCGYAAFSAAFACLIFAVCRAAAARQRKEIRL